MTKNHVDKNAFNVSQKSFFPMSQKARLDNPRELSGIFAVAATAATAASNQPATSQQPQHYNHKAALIAMMAPGGIRPQVRKTPGTTIV
jgi:hypothetical protein